MKHEAVEKNVGLLMAFTLICVCIGGMVQIFPLIFEGTLSKPIETLKPLTAVQLEGAGNWRCVGIMIRIAM